MKRAWALLPLVVTALWIACDNRACLAQSELFAAYRPELIEECCLCLARRGTARPGASCGIAQVTLDGGVVIADGGASLPPDPDFDFDGDNNDDVLDDFEVPCLCGDDANSCQLALARGQDIVIPGACLRQSTEVFESAPCEVECREVLTFTSPSVAK